MFMAIKLSFKYILILVMALLVLPADAISQSNGYMIVKGKVILNDEGLNGAKVVLLKNGTKTDEMITKGGGKFTFSELPISSEGDEYIIKISKPGHVSIKHWISTKAPDNRKVQFPTYSPTVELFKMVDEVEKEKALTSILSKPISKFSYNTRKSDFEDDRAYFSTIKARVEQLFEILEAEDRDQYRLLAEYRLKKLEEQKKKTEAKKAATAKSSFSEKYDNGIAQADKALGEKKYTRAKNLYQQVVAAVGKSKLPKADRDNLKKYPKRKIFEIETLMASMGDQPEVEQTAEESQPEEEVAENEIESVEDLNAAEEEREQEIAENKAIKAEKEMEIVEALAERDRMKKEQKEEIAIKRKETQEETVKQQMIAQQIAKAEAKEKERKLKELEMKRAKSLALKAQQNEDMLAFLARANVGNKISAMKAEALKKEKVVPSVIVEKENFAKNEKIIKEDVKIIHNRFKVAATQVKPAAKKVERPKATEIAFKPKLIETVEEEMFKTIKSTIVKYPIKQDTLQQVSYLWGAVYYYKNDKEINEDDYNKELEKY